MSHFNWFLRGENLIYIKIQKIQQGDKYLRETVIQEYKPFIIKAISQCMGKYIDVENSEEFSIALSAFNEAIDRYNVENGGDFFEYCKLIIHDRIIDYKRSNKKNSSVYPFSYFDDEIYNAFENKYLVDEKSQLEAVEIKDEILSLKKTLERFQINFDDLVLYSPKHKDSIKLCIKIARIIANNEELFAKLLHSRNIPLKELMTRVDVHQRTVERNRKFIITVTLLLKSNLDVLKGYVENTESGGTSLG
ncbi:MAG: RNA polymerase sigma-I factor [Clostridiaceae bacterium]|nr:RNA polymerase sigma-I factor [Clostridiaceae bacterium]